MRKYVYVFDYAGARLMLSLKLLTELGTRDILLLKLLVRTHRRDGKIIHTLYAIVVLILTDITGYSVFDHRMFVSFTFVDSTISKYGFKKIISSRWMIQLGYVTTYYFIKCKHMFLAMASAIPYWRRVAKYDF